MDTHVHPIVSSTTLAKHQANIDITYCVFWEVELIANHANKSGVTQRLANVETTILSDYPSLNYVDLMLAINIKPTCSQYEVLAGSALDPILAHMSIRIRFSSPRDTGWSETWHCVQTRSVFTLPWPGGEN